MIVALAVVLVMVILAGSIAYYNATDSTYASRPQVSQYTIEYPLRLSSSTPNAIAVDASGNVWFTLENMSSLAELNPVGMVHQYRIPTGSDNSTTSWGIVVDNSRGLVWFTEQATNSVWSFNIKTHQFTRYDLKTAYAFPFGIALDRQGNVWFTEFFGNKIGEITINGNINEIPIPLQSQYLEPSAITEGPQGKIWFTLPGINSIGSYYEGKFAIQNLTGLVELPVGISFDNQGNIWMTQHGPSFISEFNPVTHYFRTISTTVPSYYSSSLPYFDHVGPNSNIWFNEHEGNAMGEFIPSNNTLIEYFVPTRVFYNISGMLTSALSTAGTPWYTEFFAGKVGTINITAPLDLHLSLPNYTKPITISQKASINLPVSLSGQVAYLASVNAEVGNFTNSISYNYSKVGHSITLTTNDSQPGVYFVTVSAISSVLSYSQVIELEVV